MHLPGLACSFLLSYFVSFRNKLHNCFYTDFTVFKEYLLCVLCFLYGYGLFGFVNLGRPSRIMLLIIHQSLPLQAQEYSFVLQSTAIAEQNLLSVL